MTNAVKIEIIPASENAVIRGLQTARSSVITAGETAVEQSAEIIFERAQGTVPRSTGALASSGGVTVIAGERQIDGYISYGTSLKNPESGEPTSSYAADRHEIRNPDKPQSFKWLENALHDEAERAVDMLAYLIQNALR